MNTFDIIREKTYTKGKTEFTKIGGVERTNKKIRNIAELEEVQMKLNSIIDTKEQKRIKQLNEYKEKRK